ncbi:S8 family serine peptidase [Deinococcus taeanensis]|uniref:S8 family serine peptidase n=1 Tax=Deinococcus taeanensis TaxID=2737050 RepID=UPI001CDC71EE|nr:S8 family serine peptidase [Deinococcus taeanensis]UBV43945.1 S8 family serine peptidase [Deinococcus taeanensis]
MNQSVRTAGLLGLALAISACDQLSPAGTGLQNRSVDFGLASQRQVTAPLSGTWRVTGVPAWLRVTQQAGSGPVKLDMTAVRQDATPVTADQPTLSGTLRIAWSTGTGPDARNGTAEWTVTARQFELSGRLIEPAQVQGQDVHLRSAGLPKQSTTAAARGVIVKYRASALGAQMTGPNRGPAPEQLGTQALRARGLTVTRTRHLGGRTAALSVSDVPGALAALRADPDVEYAVPNVVVHTQAQLAQPVTPTDQFAPLQWAYPLMGYGAVWRDMESGAYTRPVTVAVVDTGVRFDHPDLQGQLWLPGEGAMDVLADPNNGDMDGPDTDPTDPWYTGRTNGSHGTHVTGIIAARWGQNTTTCAGCSTSGVVGATYRAPVKVLPVRVIDSSGDATAEDVAVGLRYAAGLPIDMAGVTSRTPHPAQVINLSLGGAVSAEEAKPMCDAVRDATDAGALVIVAAGNGYGTVPYYPAACPGAVSVASVSLSGASAPVHSPFSNAYPEVQLSAPGGADPYSGAKFNGGMFNGVAFPDMILSTGWNYAKNQPNYEAEVGTSQASPQVAALAALLLSKGVTTDAASTLARLRDTATDLGEQGRDPLFGYGMVNAAAALNAPQVSWRLGLRVQSSRGLSFQPAVDPTGAFHAYLGEGTYHVTGGTDVNGNGIYGEANEARDERQVTLAQDTPNVNVGDLTPR